MSSMPAPATTVPHSMMVLAPTRSMRAPRNGAIAIPAKAFAVVTPTI